MSNRDIWHYQKERTKQKTLGNTVEQRCHLLGRHNLNWERAEPVMQVVRLLVSKVVVGTTRTRMLRNSVRKRKLMIW